jgi:hypothetical protein
MFLLPDQASFFVPALSKKLNFGVLKQQTHIYIPPAYEKTNLFST